MRFTWIATIFLSFVSFYLCEAEELSSSFYWTLKLVSFVPGGGCVTSPIQLYYGQKLDAAFDAMSCGMSLLPGGSLIKELGKVGTSSSAKAASSVAVKEVAQRGILKTVIQKESIKSTKVVGTTVANRFFYTTTQTVTRELQKKSTETITKGLITNTVQKGAEGAIKIVGKPVVQEATKYSAEAFAKTGVFVTKVGLQGIYGTVKDEVLDGVIGKVVDTTFA